MPSEKDKTFLYLKYGSEYRNKIVDRVFECSKDDESTREDLELTRPEVDVLKDWIRRMSGIKEDDDNKNNKDQ